MMDVWEAKRTLMEFGSSEHICNIFKTTYDLSDTETESLWDNYLEFMVVKALCNDRGSDRGTLFSATPLMEKLWRCHILETSHYDRFMKLVEKVNPTMDKIHHSVQPSLSSKEDEIHRRRATAIAYRYVMYQKFFQNTF